jgi:phage virion morphogenesis protein
MFQMDISGLDEAIAKLGRAGNFDKHGLMAVVGSTVENQTRRRFAEKVSPSGAAWAPTKHGNANILIRTGALVGSINSQAGGDVVIVGTTPFYGVFHQGGTRKMVARPFVGLSKSNADEVEKIVAAFVFRQFG